MIFLLIFFSLSINHILIGFIFIIIFVGLGFIWSKISVKFNIPYYKIKIFDNTGKRVGTAQGLGFGNTWKINDESGIITIRFSNAIIIPYECAPKPVNFSIETPDNLYKGFIHRWKRNRIDIYRANNDELEYTIIVNRTHIEKGRIYFVFKTPYISREIMITSAGTMSQNQTLFSAITLLRKFFATLPPLPMFPYNYCES